MRHVLILLLSSLLLLPGVSQAAAPAVITTNAPSTIDEAPKATTPFDACRSGNYAGFDFNINTYSHILQFQFRDVEQ